jgi:hypothetical protein
MQVRGSHPLTSTFIETGISSIIEKHPGGFDLVLGADIYILEIFLPNCFYFKALAFLFFSFAM